MDNREARVFMTWGTVLRECQSGTGSPTSSTAARTELRVKSSFKGTTYI